MTERAIVSGSLQKAPTRRQSQNGNPYLMASIRSGSGDNVRWWTAFIFDADAIDAFDCIEVGEPVAVAGEFEAKVYSPPGGQPRVSLSIKVDAVLNARAPKRKPKNKEAPQPSPQEREALNDAIPF